MRCKGCGKPIDGFHVRVSGKTFHRECFTCHYCKKPIEGGYQKHFFNYFHPYCYKKKKGLKCDHCDGVLGDRWNVYEKGKYHPECFQRFIQPRCDICGRPIAGEHTVEENKKYHLKCYKNHKLPKCDVCLQPLEGRVIVDPWGNKSHAKHGTKTISCDSCARIISDRTSNGGFKLSDGRFICGYCEPFSINTPGAANRLTPLVLSVLAEVGVSDFPRNISIVLTNSRELKKKSPSRQPDMTRGLTQSHFNFLDHRRISSKHTIYILHGLPKLEFKGVLAHELLHVWLNEREIKLSHQQTEGFCNLGSQLIYKKEASRLADILLERLESNPDPNYGKGFRKMKKKLDKTGWAKLLHEVSGGRA